MIKVFKFLFCLLLVSLLPGCEGGTRGTGFADVDGNVKSLNVALPQSGLIVTAEVLDQEGNILDVATTLTDGDGNFNLQVDSREAAQINFSFQNQAASTEFQLDQVPENFNSLAIELSIDAEQAVSAENVNFDTEDPALPQDDTNDNQQDSSTDDNQNEEPPVNDDIPDQDSSDVPVDQTDDNSDNSDQVNPQRRIPLTCDVKSKLEALAEELRQQHDSVMVRVELLEKSPDLLCRVLMAAVRTNSCREAVSFLNNKPLAELNATQRRATCMGKVEISVKRPDRPVSKREEQIRGFWKRKDTR